MTQQHLRLTQAQYDALAELSTCNCACIPVLGAVGFDGGLHPLSRPTYLLAACPLEIGLSCVLEIVDGGEDVPAR